jgi:His/Glu/Gln/Arg/opine family amino acid ABC transporter permease subunit
MFKDIVSMLLFGFPVPPEMIDPAYPEFLQRPGGLVLTLLITLFSLIIGGGIGIMLAAARRDKPQIAHGRVINVIAWLRRSLASVFVEGIRALPIMLLVLLVFYLPYRLIQVRVPGFVLAVTAFSLYSGVYFAEILRSGWRSVDPALREVGRVIGLSDRQILLKIDLPIACRTMLPDLINLAVTVFKDTSTLAVVAVPEMTYVTRQLLSARPTEYELALIIVLLLYWLPATLLSALAFRVDRRQVSMGAYARDWSIVRPFLARDVRYQAR